MGGVVLDPKGSLPKHRSRKAVTLDGVLLHIEWIFFFVGDAKNEGFL